MVETFRLENGASEGSPVDDEFLHCLYQGGDLLAAGKVMEAKDVLERAFKLQPKNAKGQNLLGLTYFKLGLFDRAAEIYDLLVKDNPVDPTLRVNLGLVYLKTGALQKAIRELETAVELKGDHKKAHNYLGLAYAQAGDSARARECFVAAGSDAMVEKMDRRGDTASPRRPYPSGPRGAPVAEAADLAERSARAVAGEPAPVPVAARAPALAKRPALAAPAAEAAPMPAEQKPAAAADAPVLPEVPIIVEPSTPARAISTGAEPGLPRWGPAEPGAPAAAEETSIEAPPEETAVEAPLEEQAAVPAARSPAEPTPEAWTATAPAAPPRPLSVPMLADLTAALRLPAATPGVTFEVTGEAVVVRVEGEVRTRLEGMLGLRGTVKFDPVMKRFRGRATDKSFGEGERRMVKASGHGAVLIAPRGRVFVPFDLADESAYFREDVVFAIEEPVVFENGRVPSKIAPDLHLVHLSGRGKVLLCLPGALRSAEVRTDSPYTVPMSILAGWHGNVTPKVVGVLEVDEATASIAAVELSGEGFAILA